jgi:hypothetical protein
MSFDWSRYNELARQGENRIRRITLTIAVLAGIGAGTVLIWGARAVERVFQ